MEHTKELVSVPLASRVPSRFNVRRHSVGQVEELAALIEAMKKDALATAAASRLIGMRCPSETRRPSAG